MSASRTFTPKQRQSVLTERRLLKMSRSRLCARQHPEVLRVVTVNDGNYCRRGLRGGLIEEGAEAVEKYEGELLDAALIGAAQRVEHYEIAGYGTVIALAEELGESEHVSLLNETLEEEKATDKKLTGLAGDINAKANKSEEGAAQEEKTETKKKSRRAA